MGEYASPALRSERSSCHGADAMSCYATIQQYAEERKYHVSTVRRWLKEGMPHIGRGRTIRIVLPDADQWLTDRTTGPTNPTEVRVAQ
jgi:hypothetical protein